MIGHSGQRIGNAGVCALMAPVPLGSSFPLIYSAKHDMQYGCFPGHGRHRPNCSLAEELAVGAAEIGECVIWNGSKQMPHVEWGLGLGNSEVEKPVRLAQEKAKKKVPGRGLSSSSALDLPLLPDSLLSFSDRAGKNEEILKTFGLEDEATDGTFP